MEEEKCNSGEEGESIVRLIDVSLEDDSLISVGNQNDDDDDDDCFQLPAEDEEVVDVGMSTRMRKSGKCNLRKSLAWDAAFFTSAGVLEPEELSIINSGLTKSSSSLLMPSIEEDIRSSTSTLPPTHNDDDDGDDHTFTLFEDVRPSIHTNTNTNTNTAAQSSTKMARTKPLIVAWKRQTTNTQPFQRTKRELPESTNKEAEKPKRESAGKKKESSLRPHAQVAGRSGELNPSSLRPPKIVGRLNSSSMSPTKRVTLGASRVKNDTNTRKIAIGRKENVGSSKRPVIGDSNVTPRSTPSPRSSSSSSVSGTKLESAASCSSHDRSGSTSSDCTEISPCNPLRKKTTRNVSSASNIKPPQRIPSVNKTEVANSRPSVHHLSFSKRSSDISPASSLDGWSSESSSNSSMKVIDVSSPREGLYSERGTFQTDRRKHHRNQLCVEQKRTGLSSPCSKVSISGTGSLTRPAASDVSRSSKPTGLRMPSPKFGYFDTEKSAEPTPAGFQFHPGVRSALPKHGAGIGNVHGNTVRAKAGKLQPARNMTGKSSKNFDPHSTSGRRPYGESQECVAATKTTGQPQDFSNVSPKGTAPKAIQVICPRPQDDDKLCGGGSHLEVGDLGSLPYEGDTGGQNSFLKDMDTTSEQVSATKATGDCSSMLSELQNDRRDRTCVENYSKTEDVVGGSTNTERDCNNIYMNGRDGGEDSVVLDIGLVGKKVDNDLRKRSGSESPTRKEEMVKVTETESKKELSLKGDNSCEEEDSFVKDISILSRELLLMPIVENTCYRSGADVKIARVLDINEKENSLCFENRTDSLSCKHTSSSMEELSGKMDSSFSKFDGPDMKLSAINSREVVDQDDFPLSTNGGMENTPITRSPLAVKPFLCNETATSEFASELAMEKKVSTNN